MSIDDGSEASGIPSRRRTDRPSLRSETRQAWPDHHDLGFDAGVPGAMPTVIARVTGGDDVSAAADDTVVRAMPGVVAIVRVPSGIAVVADSFDHALRAKERLQALRGASALEYVSDAEARLRLTEAVPPFVLPPMLTKYIDVAYEFPQLGADPLEVHTAIADVRDGRADVWLAAQAPPIAAHTIGRAVGLPPDAVMLHVMRGGGSLGRPFFEPGVEAAQISHAVGRPVKLLWTHDDARHGRFRPATFHRVRVTWALGEMLTLEHRMSVAATVTGPLDERVPYEIGEVTESLVGVPLRGAAGALGSLVSATFAAANEMVIDEVARQLGRDPVAFRRSMLTSARLRAVLDALVRMGGWGRPMRSGYAQGVAVHEVNGSTVACLVEVDNTGVEPRATKVVMAADVGRCNNPIGAEAQLQGAAVDAISVMYRPSDQFVDESWREDNYTDFLWGRMRHNPPAVEVHVLASTGEPGSVVDLGFPAAAAAAANALARAPGAPSRRMTLSQRGYQA